MHTIHKQCVSATLVLLAACHHGNGNPSANASLKPDVAITASNAVEVAGAVYRSAFDLVRVARIATTFVQVAPPATTGTPTSAPTTYTQTLSGPEGGTATHVWHDADGNRTYSNGDTLAVNCDDYADQGMTLRGTIECDGLQVNGDPVTGLGWILGGRLHLVALTVTTAAGSVTLNTSLPFGRENRATVHLLSLALDGDVAIGARRLQFGSTLARNEYQINYDSGLQAEGAVFDAQLGGWLTFHTKTLLTGIQFLPDPSGGALEIRGASGSKLTLVPAGDYFNADLKVDSNGDGRVDATIAIDYASLQ